MLTVRSSLHTIRALPKAAPAVVSAAVRVFSAKSLAVRPEATRSDDELASVSPVAKKRDEMTKFSRHLVWGKTGEILPAPILPENPAELTVLDPLDLAHRTHMDGTKRTVVIRQNKKSTRQNPLNPEDSWRIFFYEDGMITEKWTNSLMGWASNADPYQSAPPLKFENALDAVYFAKKRGWNYVVHHPIMRVMRRDDCQYQDNFLPQRVASMVEKEGTQCDHWHRTSAGASHYFRPLNYHGDGLARQHGPTGNAEIAPPVEGSFKRR